MRRSRLYWFAAALALLVGAALLWNVVAGPSPAEKQRDIEKSLEQGSIEAKQLETHLHDEIDNAGLDQWGSPLWYGDRGYTKLSTAGGKKDSVIYCWDKKKDGWNLVGGMYDRDTRDWKACIDSASTPTLPGTARWDKNAELHKTGVDTRPDEPGTGGVRFSKKRSCHATRC